MIMETTNTNVITAEREDQTNVINLLTKVHGYKYIGNLTEQDNTNIREDDLKEFLQKSENNYTEEQINKAINELKQTCLQCSGAEYLMNTNKEVYSLLRNGTSVYNNEKRRNDTVNFIDWKNYTNNTFSIAEEVSVKRYADNSRTRRPDIVLYINGIAVVVLELKKSSVSVNDGISQNIRNQGNDEIPQFFTTVQLLMAGNRSQGLWYGVVGTPEKFYVHWKEPVGTPCPKERYSEYKNELERSLLQMLEPSALVDFIYNFLVFDGGIKKVARPNQYFAIKQARERIKQKESGIIWHSQGAGKSLIMIWLAKWIEENIDDSRIVIITDRDELDRQIKNTLIKTGEKVYRVESSNDLIKTLNNYEHDIICTLVHKFGGGLRNEESTKIDGRTSLRLINEQLENIANNLPKDFSPKGNIFAFVDECHRTQGGLFNAAMKKILGENTMFIGFTGTPLLKEDKKKLEKSKSSKNNSRKSTVANFGPYIHTYTFKEAVEDDVILDLRYEPRTIEQNISDKESLDKMFNKHTENLTDNAKETLKKKWINNAKLYSSKERLERIATDILQYMTLEAPLYKGYGNAMLVAEDIYQAYRYWKIFQTTELKGHCAVISSYVPIEVPLNQGYSDNNKKSEEEFKYNTAKEMFGNKSPEQFEQEVKEKFIKEPANMKLLIVVDKLLTGFDVPCATYLFIDKHMEDHTLFQAICRVNRINGPLKIYGYIVDYKDLFNCIKNAINNYSSGAFKNFDKKDTDGLLKDNLSEAKKDLEDAIAKIDKLCEEVKEPKADDDYFDYFVYNSKTTPTDKQDEETKKNLSKREEFYKACRNLIIKYLAIDIRMEQAGYTKQQADAIHKKVLDYNEIQKSIMYRSGDITDLKQYNATMRNLMDRYVQAEPSELLARLDDFSFLDIVDLDKEIDKAEKQVGGVKGIAETLEANARKVINQKRESNPEAYEKFSEQLNKLIAENKANNLDYKKLIKSIIELCKLMKDGEDNYPTSITTPCQKALYDNLENNENTALKLYNEVKRNAEKGWDTNNLRKQTVICIVKKYCSEDKVTEIMNILLSHKDEL